MKNHSHHFRQSLDRAKILLAIVAGALLLVAGTQARAETGFTSLFDGKTLNGWKYATPQGEGYGVTNGVIYCGKNGRNLYTGKTYADFVLRIEFKLEDGSNNGIAIRAPSEGDAAYSGMEIQILEDGAADRGKWGKLRPGQYHGSIYDVVPAKRGALKPPGEWNVEEITACGRHIKVVVNGMTVTDADLNEVTDPEVIRKHPGLFRERGHIGFLGHGDYIEFRNIRIKELPRMERDNTLPEEFRAPASAVERKGATLLMERVSAAPGKVLFNGKNLSGWNGYMVPAR